MEACRGSHLPCLSNPCALDVLETQRHVLTVLEKRAQEEGHRRLSRCQAPCGAELEGCRETHVFVLSWERKAPLSEAGLGRNQRRARASAMGKT